MPRALVLAGNAMAEHSAGDLALPADPVSALGAATKQYVDSTRPIDGGSFADTYTGGVPTVDGGSF